MKTLGISIDGVIRDFYSSFDKQYKKVFIDNPNLVDMTEDFQLKEPTEQELQDKAKQIEKEMRDRISLPIDTTDLLNHYQFDEQMEYKNKNDFKKEDIKEIFLTPQKLLEKFMYEHHPFRIFGDAEEFHNAMSNFNQIQAFGKRNKLFKTVLFSELKSSAISANYYFLHKVGSRARNIQIVDDNVDKWKFCDVLVDVIPETFQNKPDNKTSVKIERMYNQWDGADYSLKDLKDLNNEILLKKLFS